MFADATNISLAASNHGDLETKINAKLENVNMWLRANNILLNGYWISPKTENSN